MEIKNMNGFCELNENTMMEIDGGYRFISGSGYSGSGSVGAASVACGLAWSAVCIVAPVPTAVAFGVGAAIGVVGLM